MPYSYHIDTRRRLISLTVTGVFTTQEILGARESVLTDPAFVPGYSALVDVLDADVSTIPGAAIRDRAASTPPVSRLAIVAPAGYVFGLARMYQLVSRGEVGVFSTREDALRWLLCEEVRGAREDTEGVG